MKTFKNILLGAVICSLVVFVSCGGDDGDDAPAENARFVGAWTATNVTLNNVDVLNPEYSNFRITFNDDGSYITVDGDPVFTDTGGFYSISSSSETSASISLDGVSMNAAFSNENSVMTLNFTANDNVIGARTLGLVGDYVFVLSKQ